MVVLCKTSVLFKYSFDFTIVCLIFYVKKKLLGLAENRNRCNKKIHLSGRFEKNLRTLNLQTRRSWKILLAGTCLFFFCSSRPVDQSSAILKQRRQPFTFATKRPSVSTRSIKSIKSYFLVQSNCTEHLCTVLILWKHCTNNLSDRVSLFGLLIKLE